MTSFGIVEAMVSDQATATWYIEQEALTNLRVAGRTPYEQGMSMGVRDDWPELQSILDKAVASITPEERAAVMGRWIVLGERSIFRTRGFWLTVVGIGGVVGLGVGGILLWNRVLRRQVAVRTEALHEELVRRRDAEEALRRHRDELEDTVAQRTAELREAMRQAESANLAKSAFLSNMSHELRTPLNGVLGYAQVLRRDRQVTAGQQKSLEAIESCGHHLLTLINDVLDLSKIEAGRLEIDLAPCDLHRLLTGVDAITRPRAENKQLGLELDVSPEVPRGIVTDGTKLKQVLVNLVGNSIKFTSEGTVRVHVRETENGELEFRVQDTGIGMTDEELAEVFDPFKQAEGGRTSGGTGLGLPISKRIVEALGGSVTVESTKGAGSTFTIVHPLEEVEDEGLGELMEASLSAGVGATLAPGQDVAVLVVDDNRTNRDVLVTLLTDAGFEATEARDGAEALRILRDVRMPLVLMDIRMAGMNGLEATRAIREDPALAGTVVIAVTASVFPEFQNRASESGFDDFITKPFLVADLFARIRRHLDVVFVDPDDGAEPAAAAAAAGLGGLAPAVIRDLVPRLEAGLKVSNVSALIAIADELEAAPETAAAGALVREMTNRFAFDELKREVAELNARLEAGE
ncbi:MAG: ATP-binding protein [Planctomycetota bacterium]|jgi:signal transduction histidine kinase/CheY-like chemotaxis protein